MDLVIGEMIFLVVVVVVGVVQIGVYGCGGGVRAVIYFWFGFELILFSV